MNILLNTPIDSLRNNSHIAAMFESARSRHLDGQELEQYTQWLPTEIDRARAALDIQQHEAAVVEATVSEVLSMYPIATEMQNSEQRCARDVTYVSVYATQAMLLNDIRWLEDKFAVWFKTIVDSLRFPARSAAPLRAGFVNPFPEITRHADTLPGHIGVLHDTYARLRGHYQRVLNNETWELFEPALNVIVDTMSKDRS